MVRFVPPAPLDAATLGGAFLMLCASNRCHSIADRFCSPRLYSTSHLRSSLPPRCVDLLSSSRPFNSHASHRSSTPLRISANRLIAVALAALCKAVPQRITAEQFLRSARRIIALPGSSLAMPCHVRLSASIAAHGESERSHCCAVTTHAVQFRR